MWGTFTNGCVLCIEVVLSIGVPLDAGCPATATSPDMLQCTDGIICADWRITNRQLAIQLSVSSGHAMAIIDTLEYLKVCARWVHQSLTP